MHELALFAGAGGGILGGVLLGWRCVGAVEIDPYCREVLMARQEEGFLAPFPIWDDIRTFDGRPWRGAVDIVTAGFPCQPWSVAGKRRGKDDERNLWPDTIRVIREVGPRWALLENVPGLVRTRYFGTVLGDLAEAGYDAEWDIVSAAEVGAPHRRERLWILAHAEGWLSWLASEHEGREDPGGGSQEEPVSNTFGHDIREQSRRRDGKGGASEAEFGSHGEAEYVADASRDLCAEQAQGGAERERTREGGERSGEAVLADAHRERLSSERQSEHGAVEGAPRDHPDGCGEGRWRDGEDAANAQGHGWRKGRAESTRREGGLDAAECRADMGNAAQAGCSNMQGRGEDAELARHGTFGCSGWWLIEPDVGRVVNGCPFRVDRLSALGNMQVPRVAVEAWLRLSARFDATAPEAGKEE